jgi:hypothetical protein
VSEGWAGRRNGDLLRLMRERGFATLVTVDRNLAFQQNVAATGLAVVVVHARSNRVEDLRPLAPVILAAIAHTRRARDARSRLTARRRVRDIECREVVMPRGRRYDNAFEAVGFDNAEAEHLRIRADLMLEAST